MKQRKVVRDVQVVFTCENCREGFLRTDGSGRNPKFCRECLDPSHRKYRFGPVDCRCVDCDAPFVAVGLRGRLPERCDSCRAKRLKSIARNARLMREYGITQSDYERMYDDQRGRCAACGSAADLEVEHDHSIGSVPEAVRGLACADCNHIIGRAKDSPQRLRSVAAYLDRFNARRLKVIA